MAIRGRGPSKSLRSAEHAKFRAVLIEAREKAGLTQEQLAKRLGRPQSFVAKYEGGERRLDMVEFLWVTKAMKVDPLRVLRTLIDRVG
jgi:transcriptional regulator with XRE-family HTH domain